MKRIYLDGNQIRELFGPMGFREFLARPGKNELLYSNKHVDNGSIYYLTNNYFDALLLSLRTAIENDLLKKDVGISLLNAFQSATEDDGSGEDLRPHIYAM